MARWSEEDGRIVGEGWQEKVYNRGIEEAPKNSKESLHSAQANGMNEWMNAYYWRAEHIYSWNENWNQ
jgi:hypothetical protein